MAENIHGMVLGDEAFFGEIRGSLMLKGECFRFVADGDETPVFVTVPLEAVRFCELTESGEDASLCFHCLGKPQVVEFRLVNPVGEWKDELARVLPGKLSTGDGSYELVADSQESDFIHAYIETEDEYFARTQMGRE